MDVESENGSGKWHQSVYCNTVRLNLRCKVSLKRSKGVKTSISRDNIDHLPPANLPLRNRPHPRQTHVQSDDHASHDPEHPRVLTRMVAEDDGEDDTTKVTRCTNNARQDTVSVRVDVRDEGKVGTIPGFHEDGHECDKSNHSIKVVRVQHADDDEEYTAHDADEVDPELLRPEAAVGVLVDQVADEAAQRASHDVEETEHGGPATRLGLAKVGEVLEVVGSEDGVDGKLAAEGAEVASAEHDCLWGGYDLHCFFEGRLDDDLVLGFVDDLAIRRGGGGGFDVALGVLLLLIG